CRFSFLGFSLSGSSMRRTGCLLATLRRGGTGVSDLRRHGPMKHDPGLLHTLNPYVLISQREVGQEDVAVEELKAILSLEKAHRFVLQKSRNGGLVLAALQLHSTLLVEPPDLHALGIFGALEHLGHRACRSRIVRRGWRLPQRFVGPDVVVVAAEAVEDQLLLDGVVAWWPGGLFAERPMHALVPTILLGVPRLDALGLDPKLHPPDRQLAEPSDTRRGERRTVVRANA